MKCSSGSSRYGSIGSVRPWASAAGSSTNAADGVRVPVDLELEARLAVALDQHQRRRRGLQPDLQARGAAQRARVHARARQLEQRLGDLLRERQPAPVAALLGQRGELLRQLAGDPVEHEPARAGAARGGDAPDPALDRARQPLLDVRRDLELREALDHALDVGGGGVRARRPPLLGLPVEAPAGDRAHGVDDVRPVREREDHRLVPVGVAPELDVGHRIGCAHPPTVASADGRSSTWRSIVAAVCGRRSWKTWRRPASVRTVSAACLRRTRVRDLGDVAERQRVHARHGRVVEQPQQPALGDGEDRARAGPGRGRRDQPHVLARR